MSKAKELVEKYSQLLYKSTFDELHFTLKRIVKQCALIAVYEKEETLLDVIGTQPQMWTSHEKSLVDDLEQVRKEIEAL